MSAKSARTVGLLVLTVLLSGCDRGSSPAPPISSSRSPLAAASRPPRRMAGARAQAPSASVARDPLESQPLSRLEFEPPDKLTGKVANPELRVRVEIATRQRPLAHRGPVAYERVARRIAPGLVHSTVLRAFELGELLEAASDPRTRGYLKQHARVLADGRVRAALSVSAQMLLERVDLADLVEAGRVFRWESALVRRELPPQSEQAALAAYQALLCVDYLVGNLERRAIFLEPNGKLVAIEDNRVFSAQPVQGGVGEPLARLARHTTFSRGLAARVRALEPDILEKDLRGAADEGLLLTPKQLGDITERRRTIEKLISGLTLRRGEARALALP